MEIVGAADGYHGPIVWLPVKFEGFKELFYSGKTALVVFEKRVLGEFPEGFPLLDRLLPLERLEEHRAFILIHVDAAENRLRDWFAVVWALVSEVVATLDAQND